jgi:hypothetical protein
VRSRNNGIPSHAARWSGEDGAVAAMVILGIAALLGAALVAIDGGSILHTRRGLVADTDASALATAIELLDDRCAAQPLARTYAQQMASKNSDETTVTEMALDRGGDCTRGYGTVQVFTEHPAKLFFAPFFGVDDFKAGAASTAAYGRIQALEGLRPIGLCGAEAHYQEWAAVTQTLRAPPTSDDAGARAAYDALRGSAPDHPAYAGAGVVHRIPFQRLGTGACDLGAPGGNWGWLDYDGGSNSNADLDRWLEFGYDGVVGLGGVGQGDEDCDDTEPGFEDCAATPGGRGASTKGALNSIRCAPGIPTRDCLVVYVVVFDAINGGGNNGGGNNGGGNNGGGNNGGGNNGGGNNGGGNGGGGSNISYHPASFAGVILRAFDLGTGQEFGDSSWIEIEFVDELMSGLLGPSSPTDPYPGPRGVAICATETFDDC